MRRARGGHSQPAGDCTHATTHQAPLSCDSLVAVGAVDVLDVLGLHLLLDQHAFGLRHSSAEIIFDSGDILRIHIFAFLANLNGQDRHVQQAADPSQLLFVLANAVVSNAIVGTCDSSSAASGRQVEHGRHTQLVEDGTEK